MKDHATASQIRLLILPSWLSALVSITLAVVIVVVAAIIARVKGSVLDEEIFAFHSATAGAAANTQTIAANLSHNRLFDNLPLFAFWAGIGLIVYLFATHIVKAFSGAAELKQEMHYVHANRQVLIRQAAVQTLVRLVALVGIMAIVLLSLHKVLPAALEAAHALAGIQTAHTILVGLLWTLFLALDVSALTVGLRLLLLRPRLFGTSIPN